MRVQKIAIFYRYSRATDLCLVLQRLCQDCALLCKSLQLKRLRKARKSVQRHVNTGSLCVQIIQVHCFYTDKHNETANAEGFGSVGAESGTCSFHYLKWTFVEDKPGLRDIDRLLTLSHLIFHAHETINLLVLG